MEQETLLRRIAESADFAEVRNSGILPDPDGDDGYYFVSYSHRDYKRVLADVIAFQADGLKIWYDRGLESGKSWLSEVKKKITSYYCKGVIVYLSENYVVSASCIAELAHIASQNKPCVFISLDGTANVSDEELAAYVDMFVCLPFECDETIKTTAIAALPKPKLFEYYIQPATRINAFMRIGKFAVVKKLLDKNVRRAEIPQFTYINGKKYRVRGAAYFAFENCELLEEVSVPDGWIVLTENAFVNCPSLKRVELGAPYGAFGVRAGTLQHAFVGCDNLREITCADKKANIMLLGTFGHNKSVKDVELPEAFRVDARCFESCTTLEKITLHKKDGLDRGHAFCNCVSLKEIVIPPDNLSVAIGEKTFFNCVKLESVRIPARVEEIHRSAFERCASLREITLPEKIAFIDPTAFAECVRLNEVAFAGDVRRVLDSPVGRLYLDEIFAHAEKFYSALALPLDAFCGAFKQAQSDKKGFNMYVKEAK